MGIACLFGFALCRQVVPSSCPEHAIWYSPLRVQNMAKYFAEQGRTFINALGEAYNTAGLASVGGRDSLNSLAHLH